LEPVLKPSTCVNYPGLQSFTTRHRSTKQHSPSSCCFCFFPGWFTEPSPFFTGGLSERQAGAALSSCVDELLKELAALPAVAGVLTLRLHVNGGDGVVSGVEFLADTLVPLPGAEEHQSTRADIQYLVQQQLLGAQFPAARNGQDTFITLPLVFE
jgi:hypothetical protein